MRIDYIFRCKKCGSGNLIQHTTNITRDERLTITDYGAGPEIEVVDEDYYHDDSNWYTIFICGSCGWELPINSNQDLIEYIIANHEKREEEDD